MPNVENLPIKGFEDLTNKVFLPRAPSVLFAISLVVFPMLLIIFGALGMAGSSLVTGLLLAFLPISLCCFGLLDQAAFGLSIMDGFFVLFLIPIVLTGFEFHDIAEIREILLFVICSILAYGAGRLTSLEKLEELSRYTLIASISVVAAACLTTIPELYKVWNVAEQRPFVFGFEHAVNVFAMATGPLIFGFVYSRRHCKPIQFWAVMILIYLASFLFVASLVRYTFVAILTSTGFILVVSVSMRDRVKTCRVALAMAAVILGILSGFIARHASVYSFLSDVVQGSVAPRPSGGKLAITRTPEWSLSANPGQVDNGVVDRQRLPPSCELEVGINSSISIRRALYRDSFYIMWRSGLFGIGLDNFKKVTCIKDHQVHNIYLQAIIEAGWLGGAALLALTLCPFLFLSRAARTMDPGKFSTFMFLVVSFCFAALLGLAHGTLNRELTVFLALGAVSGGIALRRTDTS